MHGCSHSGIVESCGLSLICSCIYEGEELDNFVGL